MSGFKLLAIIPLQGCDKKFRNNLKIGNKYLFYNNYDIELDETFSEVISVKCETDPVPKNLFHLENGIKLNISAIVGENGSGKSTLFELMYYLIYILSSAKRINNDRLLYHESEEIESQIAQLTVDYRIEQIEQLLKGSEIRDSRELIICQLIKKYELDDLLGTTREGEDLLKQLLTELSSKKQQYKKILKAEQKNEKDIRDNLAVSVLFTKNNSIYELSYSNQKLTYNEFTDNGKKELTIGYNNFDLQNFFYNVSINYSIHALNSNTIGNWVSKLFHKNDAYITPVVINPMRDEGNFDINKELYLSKERLMANVLYDILNDKETLILDKYKVKMFIFEIKKEYRYPFPIDYNDSFFREHIVGKLLKKGINLRTTNQFIPDQHGYAIAYLDRKIDKIKEQYGFLIYQENQPTSKVHDDEILLNFLLNDKSHITKKIRQTLNFIKYGKLNPTFWKFIEGERKVIDSKKMITWIKKCNSKPEILSPNELIEIALPGFLNVDFEFYYPNDQKHPIELGKMSSGEQQMMLNINSILYHLYNIQSIHLQELEDQIKPDEKTPQDRIKYSNVNIILDEIELYYHPDTQRLLVNNLVNSLERVRRKMETGIESINICFITHSPFILSDIPSNNILRLSKGVRNEFDMDKRTFGANIYDLLNDQFFFKHGYIGEFAFGKLNEVIGVLNDNKDVPRIEKRELRQTIELVGEEFLREKLLSMYFGKYQEDFERENEIELLRQKIKRLEND